MNTMTRRWRRLTVAALLLSVMLFSPRSPAEPITLEQARALALKNNHSLQSIQAKLDAARGDVKEANAFLFNNPELNGDVGRRRITEGSESEMPVIGALAYPKGSSCSASVVHGAMQPRAWK